MYWKKVKELTCDDIPHGAEYRIRTCGRKLIIEKRVVEVDITDACVPEYRQSSHSNGRYVALCYRGAVAVVMGECGVHVNQGFRVERARGATYSFRIYKTE